MNDVEQYDPKTGEILTSAVASMNTTDIPLAVRLAKVELDQAISTAKAYPRSMTLVRDRISELVMLDEETAAECVYALPRGGKPIKGPSVRFAEIVASQFGNCKVGSRVVDVNKFEKYIEAEGVFIDLESGMQRTARIRRKISDKNGRVYNDDMIVVTGNAACSIALREAILKGVPKALWRKAYADADAVIAGDVKTLAVRRDGAIKAFAVWGVTPDQIFAALEIEGTDDIGMDQIGTLTAMFKAIKSGEQQAEDYFPAKVDKAAGIAAAKGTAGKLSEIAKSKGKDATRGSTANDGTKGKAAEETSQGGAAGSAEGGDAGAGQEQTGGTTETGGDSAQDGQQAAGEGQGDAEAEEAHQAAYERGRKAHGRGMKADAIPSDLKGELRDVWVEGWQSSEAEKGGEA